MTTEQRVDGPSLAYPSAGEGISHISRGINFVWRLAGTRQFAHGLPISTHSGKAHLLSVLQEGLRNASILKVGELNHSSSHQPPIKIGIEWLSSFGRIVHYLILNRQYHLNKMTYLFMIYRLNLKSKRDHFRIVRKR
ncbi:hypothetical protein TNCT_136081 [Trichonephila clavata]|uniref:Uncharacterized protein n=1 Tax=Trichonephila clavata TaxID=2740835 RepID=A0A8X6KS44_TRICU|nr:hypothetical protein TNCT_136081 [Trichonephila clavata]